MNETKAYFALAVKIILFILLLIGLYFIRDIVLMLLVSIILAALFVPLVDWLETKKISRLLSTVFIYFFIIFLFVGVIFIIVPIFSNEFTFFTEKIGDYYQNLRSLLGNNQTILPENFINIPNWQNGLGFVGQGVFSFIGNIANWIFTGVLVFILSFYITLEKKSLIKFLISLFPKKYHNFVDRLLVLFQKDLSAWGLAMIGSMLSVGILTYIGLLILNLKFAFVLSFFAGITEIIPWVGPFIGAAPAIFIALFQSPMAILLVVLLYIIVQQIVNNIIMPVLMKKTVGLDPIVVITVLLIGAKLGGMFGAIIAVPAAAIVSIFIKEYLKLKEQVEEK
jgi:predicted PurR-regulated permease PerM